MAFTVRRTTALTPAQAWAAVTDFTGHAAAVPLTSVSSDPGPPRVGWSFVMATGLGPLRMLDRMTVTEWVAGERCRIVKTGRPLDGWARIVVRPAGHGALVEWTEEIGTRPPGTGRLSRAVADRLAPRLFAGVVESLLAAAEQRAGRTQGRSG